MPNTNDLLQRSTPDTWLRRFLAGASNGDVAFVTPGGHVLSWSQFRFAYPCYQEIESDWQPPSHGLDAFVLHFGTYELVLPATELGDELRDLSAFSEEHERLARAWEAEHPSSDLGAAMEARIMSERIAAVHARFEVTMALFAHEREPLQDLFAVPGVRMERSQARLSEVSLALHDERPPDAALDRERHDTHAAFLAARSRAAARSAEAEPPAVDADRMRRLTIRLRLASGSRLSSAYDAIAPEYHDDVDAFARMLFLEAVRREATAQELLRLVRAVVADEERPTSGGFFDARSWPWAHLAERLEQHRTAWCLATRAFAGLWRRGRAFAAPYGSLRPAYAEERSTQLATLARLAMRSRHPYWSTVFATWAADYDRGRDADTAHAEPDGGDAADDAWFARLRATRPHIDTEE